MSGADITTETAYAFSTVQKANEPKQSLDFGKRLGVLRGDASQEAFGHAIGVTRNTITRLEANETKPGFDTLLALREHLGMTLEELVFGEDMPPPRPKISVGEALDILRKAIESRAPTEPQLSPLDRRLLAATATMKDEEREALAATLERAAAVRNAKKKHEEPQGES